MPKPDQAGHPEYSYTSLPPSRIARASAAFQLPAEHDGHGGAERLKIFFESFFVVLDFLERWM